MLEVCASVASVVSAVLDVGKCLAAPIGRQFMYLYNYKSNFENLEKEVGKLKVVTDQVNLKVNAAQNNVEEINQNVKDWQENVNSTLDEADKLIEKKANNRCFKGFCPHLSTCYKHSKEALERVKAVSELLKEGGTFREVSHPTSHEDIRLTNKDYEAFESRNLTLNNVLKALNDANVDMIGVYGMGGIGKTTLVKEVGKKAKEDKLFDGVVFVEVTDTPDIKKIQEEIANKLGLTFDKETERANKLYARLKKGEKILVILDNIWEQLDLMTVGIPSGADHGGCKLLLTARDLNVLMSMDSTNNILMGVLNEEEAWGLFKKMAGDVIEESELQSLPNDVCKKCGGLPIAIVTVAKALRNKRHLYQWKDALQRLNSPSPANFTGVLKKPYLSIELSYNYLRDEELKKTFLLCSLMGHDAPILELVKYVMGLDIFQDIYTMKDARHRVCTLIHELKDSCLLLNDHRRESCSMHDFVREVAITIANRDDHVFSVRNEMKWEWPRKDTQNFCRKIFIRDSSISKLAELECPQLESFFMNTKNHNSHVDIPENFFTRMTKLKVLHLTRMKLLSLRSSLHLLVNLQTLCLNYSKFEDVAIIGELKELKILSLRDSNVVQLPREIGQLTQLRLLDLSYCGQLKVIAPNVISRLEQLEELYMSECSVLCSVLWTVEEQNVERSDAILEELTQLSSLNTLEIDIKNFKVLPKGLFSKKLESYKISIGDRSSRIGELLTDDDSGYPMSIKNFHFYEQRTFNTLKLKLNSTIYPEELQGIKNVEFLCLDKLQGIENVLYKLDKEGFSQMKHLCVQNNPNLLCIVDSTKCVTDDVFPAFPLLESLILSNLIELEKICYGQPTTGSFCSLKIIEVKTCVELKNIFSFSNIARSLPQLQRIRVEDCENMKEIFVVEREENVNNIDEVIDEIEFCQLRFLTLGNLPRLASFCSEVKTPSTLQSDDINLEDELEPLESLFNEKFAFPNLEELRLSRVNFEKIWDNQLPTMSSCYQNLTRLIIWGCGKLKYVFPYSIVQSFKQLQHLEIRDCWLLKEIVGKGGREEETARFVFPRVTVLKLENLPKLTTFYPGIHTSEWPMFEKLEVHYCDKVKIFNSENNEKGQLETSEPQSLFLVEKFVFPNLEELRLYKVNSEMIWDNQLPTISSCYQNLTHLIIWDCGKLKYAFPSSIVESFKQLQHLEICNCKLLKEIVAKGKGEEETTSFVFPRVTFLKLNNLPKLTSFYPEMHSSEWPMLETLEVYHCDKVKIFISENNEKGQLDIPLGILQRCNNLKQLELEESSYKEIFSYGKDEKHIGKQDSKLDSVLQNLEVLQVREYHRLFNVVPSSVSFQNLTILRVMSCSRLVNLIASSIAKSLTQLTEMTIRECRMMIEIVENDGDATEDEIVFNKLKLLSLKYLESLICFCFGNNTLKFPSLEVLIVKGCNKVKTFSGGDLSTPMLQKVQRSLRNKDEDYLEGDLNTTIQQLHKEKVINPNLKALTLSGKDTMPIWQGQFPEYEFDKVESLEVVKDESTNIPLEILYRFNNLEKLVLKASSYKEVFSCGGDKKHYDTLTLLKILEVLYCCDLITLMPSSTSFENLTTLKVWHCHGLRNLVTSSTAKSLVRLAEMIIEGCKMMKEVVAKERDVEKDEIVFRKLQKLSLEHLESLTSFCSGNYTFKFPSLGNLNVINCSKMKTFSEGLLSTPRLEGVMKSQNDFPGCWEGDLNTTIQQLYKMVVFPNLEALNLVGYESEKIWDIQLPTLMSSSYQNLISLILRNFEELKYVFSSSIVKSFEQLQHLEIRDCLALEGIVAKEGETEAAATFVFPQVTFLRLTDLPELTSFYPGKHTSEWPLLKYLEVRNCDKVKIFTSEYLSFHESTEPQPLFLVEKINPNLEKMKLSGMDSMMTWQCQFLENLVCRFKVLEISDQKSANIPLGIIQRCNNLKHLKLDWSSYKEIFSCGEDEKHTQKEDSKLESILQNLEVLEVRWCPRLINVVPSSASFQNLTVLTVELCDGLANLITSSTAKSLAQLAEMKIERCKMMIEIIENEGDVAEDEIVFKKLKWLSLEQLESLTCFSFGNYTLKFPSLEELNVERCPKMKTFFGGVLSTPSLQKVWVEDSWLNIEGCLEGELNTIIQQLHKKVAKEPKSEDEEDSETPMSEEGCDEVNSSLKELTLSGKDIWQDQFSQHEFNQVKVLEVVKDESTNIPIEILQRFNNLKKLILKVCSYEEIFACGKKGKHIAVALSQLKILELRGLFNLKYMWKQDSYLESILQNLEILEVEYCHNLITLVPSSSSFENLRTLKVWYCDGLMNLVSSSIAKSLVQLEEMKIEQCQMMIEVVANELVEDEILFSKLKKLSLESLESLQCFCSGNYTFKFPSLENLIVSGCPKIKTFSGGVSSAPWLQRVNYSKVKYWKACSGHDLNTVIQQLHIIKWYYFCTFDDMMTEY